MAVRLVSAGTGDAPAVAHLIRELALSLREESPVTARTVRAYLGRRECRVILAKDGEEVAGLISCSLRPGLFHAASSCVIEDLFVKEEFRRRGIADRLVAEVIRRAEKAHCAEVSVSTEVDNRKALSLYRKHGLTEEFRFLEMHFQRHGAR